MDILLLLLTKKHDEVLSEELRQDVIREFIIKAVESNTGYFTSYIRFRGKIHKYVECYSFHNCPLPFFNGTACIIRYEPSLYLYVVWDEECLFNIAAAQENLSEYNIRVAVINWDNHPIDFAKWGLKGGNIISKRQIATSIKHESGITSWDLYQKRCITPRS